MTDHPSALVSVPETVIAACEGEQEHFEDWAKSSRYDMSEHPLHYIFMDPKADAARMGWNAALAYVRNNAAAPAAPQAAGVGEDWRTEYNRIESIREAAEGQDRIARGTVDPIARSDAEAQAAGHWERYNRELDRFNANALRAPSREPEGGAVDERLKWFLKVIEGAGGEVCSTESRHNPINVFCEDRDKGDDTFNISEAAGYTQTSHDTSFDTSTTRITDKGRAYLAALTPRHEAPASAGYAIRSHPCYDEHQAGCDCVIPAQTETEVPTFLKRMTDTKHEAPAEGEAARKVEWVNDASNVNDRRMYIDGQQWAKVYGWDKASLDARCDALQVAMQRTSSPSADKLRIAVEALENASRILADKAIMPVQRVSWASEDIEKALAALQAEQKGGA